VLTELLAKNVDAALMDEQLKLTPEQRLLKLDAMMRFNEEARRARAAAIPAAARRHWSLNTFVSSSSEASL